MYHLYNHSYVMNVYLYYISFDISLLVQQVYLNLSFQLIIYQVHLIPENSKNIEKIFNNWKRKEDNFGLSQIFVLAHEEFINAENFAIAEDRINKSTEIIINRQEERLEEGLSFLSTVASVSPFIGLFGTVWGVMNAFSGLAQLSQVSINAVAPGISEALVATALGLFAAIPALISYNWSVRSIDTIIKSYENFTSELLITYQEYNVQEKRKK